MTVNTVSPGMVVTDQSSQLCEMTPLARFLASQVAAFITGGEPRVDGGWTIWWHRPEKFMAAHRGGHPFSNEPMRRLIDQAGWLS